MWVNGNEHTWNKSTLEQVIAGFYTAGSCMHTRGTKLEIKRTFVSMVKIILGKIVKKITLANFSGNK